MTNVIDSLKKEQEELKKKLEQITAAIACLTSVAQVGNALSEDVRKRMSVGMKRYWAQKKRHGEQAHWEKDALKTGRAICRKEIRVKIVRLLVSAGC